jgi:hypothetical protein
MRADRVVAAALFATVMLLAAACAESGGDTAGPGSGTATPAQDGHRFHTYSAEVFAVRQAADPRRLQVDVGLRDPRGCVRNPQVSYDDERVDLIWLSARIDMAEGVTCGPVLRKATVDVMLPKPVAGRDLVIQSASGGNWALKGGQYRPCDQNYGCHPAPTGCTTASYEQTVAGMDAPKHGVDWDVRGCDGRWMVMDVTVALSACPGQEPGPANPCIPGTTRRVFYRNNGGLAWTSVYGTVTHQRCPPDLPAEFPRRLCATLPPLG